jgi:hypothetical protein
MKKWIVVVLALIALLPCGSALADPAVSYWDWDKYPSTDNVYDIGGPSNRLAKLYSVDVTATNLDATDIDVTDIDAATGSVDALLSGKVINADARTSATARAVTAAESGKVFVLRTMTGTVGNAVFTLPTCSAGLTYTFIDANVTAAADLWITAAAGDKINGGTAAKSYISATDAVKQSVTIVGTDAEYWEIVSEVGTWANDNN